MRSFERRTRRNILGGNDALFLEAAIFLGVGMRLIPRVDQRTAFHRVDRTQHTEKIGSLGDLKDARLAGAVLAFHEQRKATVTSVAAVPAADEVVSS